MPEFLGVVWLAEVHKFVDDDVVHDMQRSHHKAAAEGEATFRVAGAEPFLA